MDHRGYKQVVARLGLFMWLWYLCLRPTRAFSWTSEKATNGGLPVESPTQLEFSGRRRFTPGSHLTNAYNTAIDELQELESEPLCHRVAARLLVDNCQLLDGKNEATVLTDSGRQIRDFVDSYAASLAICDLHRGNFVIPQACAKFREAELVQLAVANENRLHVSSREIDVCLRGLAASDSAWNTWISYRHKAIRFCEAARVDNEKTQSILFYQRLTKVMGKLAEGVEADIQKRMDELDAKARQASESLAQLAPEIDLLRDGLSSVHDYLSLDLHQTLKMSHESVQQSLENAANLQQVLGVLTKTVLESNSQLAVAHDTSLQHVARRTGDEMNALMVVIANSVASSVSLQTQMEETRLQALQISQRQEALEQGLDRLVTVTENLSSRYTDHAHLLTEAANMTHDILDSLEEAAATATTVNNALLTDRAVTTWWPYILCPTASLVMGSYGLPPSAARNLVLIALGEILGAVISLAGQIHLGLHSAAYSFFTLQPAEVAVFNVTDSLI